MILSQLIAVLSLFYVILYYIMIKKVPSGTKKTFIVFIAVPGVGAILWALCSYLMDNPEVGHVIIITITDLVVIACILLNRRGYFNESTT